MMTRRGALGVLTSTLSAAALEQEAHAQQAAAAAGIPIGWLGGSPPAFETGVSWGVPFARGTMRKDQPFSLTGGGKSLPLQTWPLAWWPDGSVKFLGCSTVAGPAAGGALKLAPGTPPAATALKISEAAGALTVDTGRMQCRIARQGSAIVDSISIEGRDVARAGRLVCSLADRPERLIRFEDFTSRIRNVTAEQTGPVRAVIKVEGVHASAAREWLPFVVRLYFYAGIDHIRMVHTIVFDDDH
ncbi:MAG TPA: hypothetical protein VGF59_08810, partial [Bryobacteraceae bacterium]